MIIKPQLLFTIHHDNTIALHLGFVSLVQKDQKHSLDMQGYFAVSQNGVF